MMMHRQQLVSHMGLLLTVDTVTALQNLRERAHEVGGWKLVTLGPTPGTHDRDPLSLIPAGRELRLRLERQRATVEEALFALWGCAVPLGFTPWTRYPVCREETEVEASTIFHYYGEWTMVLDRLLAEGRGHLAWPSLCCAAQVDVGAWRGDHPLERFVQAQAHRVGAGCGPVDGRVGTRTLSALGILGIPQMSLEDAARLLSSRSVPSVASQDRRRGHLALPGCSLTVHAFGGVKVTRTPQGANLAVDGPGRLILDVGEAR